MNRDLSQFSGILNFSIIEKCRIALWFCTQHLIFKSPFLPSALRPLCLNLFGATIGKGVLIRRGVRVHFPWNLTIGDNCWIGEEVWFINHEKIVIGSHVCISQRSVICSGGHDFRSFSLEYANNSIEIKDGAWVCLDAKVLPGVTIGECSVVASGEVARKTLPDYSMLAGGQVRPIDAPR